MQQQILFKNATVSFTDAGKGTAVVFLHGFLESSNMWQGITPALANKYRIITIDLLGHGNSENIGYVNAIDVMAESVLTVLKHLKIRKCYLVGHSLGGYVAVAFADLFGNYVKGLCLINSAANADTDAKKKTRNRAIAMAQHSYATLVRLSFMNLFTEAALHTFSKAVALGLKEAYKVTQQTYIATQKGMQIRPNRLHVLKNATFKTLLILGKKDAVIVYKDTVLEAIYTNTNYVSLDTGHMSVIEDPKAVISSLKEFLK